MSLFILVGVLNGIYRLFVYPRVVRNVMGEEAEARNVGSVVVTRIVLGVLLAAGSAAVTRWLEWPSLFNLMHFDFKAHQDALFWRALPLSVAAFFVGRFLAWWMVLWGFYGRASPEPIGAGKAIHALAWSLVYDVPAMLATLALAIVFFPITYLIFVGC